MSKFGRFLFFGIFVIALALPGYAGPWGQDRGSWYTQFEASGGHIQGDEFRTDALSAYAEVGIGRGFTVSANHFTSFSSSVSGVEQVSEFSGVDTRFALQKRLKKWPIAAIAFGAGHSRRSGYKSGLRANANGPGFELCPEYYTDVFANLGYKRTSKKGRPILYVVEARFDLNGKNACKDIRLNTAIITQYKHFTREVHIWHTFVDETLNIDFANRLSSTKYRVLYRADLIRRGSVYVAYTAERSNKFVESSVSVGIARSFG